MKGKKIAKKSEIHKVDYPISLNYRSKWGEWEAVREFVTNAIDSGGEVSMERKNAALTISDTGRGIELHHLLIGEGEADGIDTIGKFHEGMKIAIVTLLRLGKTLQIRSNGLRLIPEITEMFNRKVLRICYEECAEHLDGTIITIHGIKRDYAKKFRNFDGAKNHDTLLVDSNLRGKLFIKGIYVREIESIFGYDLNMERANPNTGEPDWYEIKRKVALLITRIDDTNVVKEIARVVKLNKWRGCLEFEFSTSVMHSLKEMWRKAFKSVYGQRVCNFTDADSARLVAYENKGIVLNDIPYVVKMVLPDDVEIKRAPKKREKAKKIQKKDLSASAQSTLKAVRRLFTTTFQVYPKVKVQPLEGVKGQASYKGYITLDPSVLKDKHQCFATYLHEFVHWYYGYDDLSQEFINAMGGVAAKIYYSKKYPNLSRNRKAAKS